MTCKAHSAYKHESGKLHGKQVKKTVRTQTQWSINEFHYILDVQEQKDRIDGFFFLCHGSKIRELSNNLFFTVLLAIKHGIPFIDAIIQK